MAAPGRGRLSDVKEQTVFASPGRAREVFRYSRSRPVIEGRMGGRLACVFIIGGLAAAHCAVIFWPPLPCLTIHRLPDDTVSANASVTGYSNPGESSRPLIMG